MDGEADIQLPHEIEDAAFRIAQEALNNALKHAHATAITVRIAMSSTGGLELEVSDNGKGFDYGDDKEQNNLGLKGMNERAEKINAA